MNIKTNTCCFIGHRTIDETEELKSRLKEIIEKLIIDEKVDTFLFGSKSRFNSLCREIVTEICMLIFLKSFNFLLYIIKNIVIKKFTQGYF